MKKILFTLLLFTGYLQAQTYPVNPTKFGKISLNTNGISTSTAKINTQEADGQINYIDAVNLPVPTTVTNALDLKTTVSAGAVSGFTLTNNGNGTVNIASGIAYLRLTNDPYSSIVKYPISAVTNLALTDNANNYVLVDYNGGSPTITVTTNGSIINTQTNSLAYVISRVGNTLDYLNLVGQNVDPNAKLRVRFLNQEGIRRASGATIGFSNRNLTLTSSVLFSGLIRLNAPAFNTQTPDTFTLAYNNGSVWARTTGQTQINNTQYNVSGVLTTMPNNDYRTDYVYLLPNNPSKLYVIMGTTTYNSLTLAKGAPRPSALPVELQVLGVEVGRLFIQKNSTTIAEVQSSFANDFVGAGVPEHNSLSGLQGGLADQRNHLDNAQVSLVNGSEQSINKATDFTTVNNILYPTVQAAKNQLDLKAIDAEVIHKQGEILENSIAFDPLLSQDSDTIVRKRVLEPESTRLPISSTTILGWGDSLTAGSGGTPYTTTLAQLTNFNIINKGVGGESAFAIKNRMVADVANYDKSVIIWAGRNGYANPENVKFQIAEMVSTLTHTRFLVVGILNGDYAPEYKGTPSYNTIVQLNEDLKSIYGNKYVPIREYLVSLNDGTTQGNIDFANDVPPYYLRSDQIHLNTLGYTKVAEFFNKYLGNLFEKEGYLQSKDFSYYHKLYTGTGTSNFLTKWVDPTTQGISSIQDNGSIIGYGGTPSSNAIHTFYGSVNSVYEPLSTTTTLPGSVGTILNQHPLAGSASILRFSTLNQSSQSATGYMGFASTTTNFQSIFVLGRRTGLLSYEESFRITHDGNFLFGKTTSNGKKFQVQGAVSATEFDLSQISDTSTAATHYFVETATDGNIRPKTLANVKTEIVTLAAIDSAKPNIASTISPIFTGTPEAPTPTTTNGIANKGYVDGVVNSNVVLLTGNQTKLGTLTFDSNSSGILDSSLYLRNDSTSLNGILGGVNNSTGTFFNFVNISTGVLGRMQEQGGGVGLEISSGAGGTAGTALVLKSALGHGSLKLLSVLENTTEKAYISDIGDFSAQKIIAQNTVRLKDYTVDTLPAGTQGDTAYVTDALAPTYMATVVGGGAVVTPVFYNGTAWVCH